ncbi:MAG: hypothetical protein ICV55_10885 [Coleofasciculus sp. C3-bin4]|nr:hypothetical protein [Coleofasciculus sp. Co-bin14]MBD0363257.1 hypothetical protein [Coleofasciculus sp. C3-bin4]
MANQTRIVLDSDDRPKAEQILEATGIKTFSQLFSIFLINYGDHLVTALKTPPTAPPPPVAMPKTQAQVPHQLPTIKPSVAPTQAQQFKPMSF